MKTEARKIDAARQKWRRQIFELTPLEYLLKVMNKRGVSRYVSIAAARAALPYCHAKLRPVAFEQCEPTPEEKLASEEAFKIIAEALDRKAAIIASGASTQG